MTAVLDETPAIAEPASDRPGSWPARAGALAVDLLPALAVIATMVILAWNAPPLGWLCWVFIVLAALVFVLMVVNRLLLPTLVGNSLGRALFGIRVVRRDGSDAGLGRLVLRDLAHLLDTAAVCVGWLWPLWDGRNRTFADLLTRTEVRRTERPERNLRRDTAVMLMAASVLCAAAVGVSYVAVYRHDRAQDAARAEISEQGPRIVEQMLSYGVDSIQKDFAHARELVTDNYRPQLAEQQEAVQKAGPTTNEYWSVSSAVLSASKNQASMLLAMQGQRGTDPKSLKFITATVRVEFDKSRSDGHWRIANLTVLKKPQMNGGPQ